jgi:hypothetical protein
MKDQQVDGYQWKPIANTREEVVPVVLKFKELSTTAQVVLSYTTCFPVPPSSNLTTKVYETLFQVFVRMWNVISQ